MLSIRALVVKALDDTADILSNARFAQALAEGQDIDLEDIGVDSLSRFEAIMQIEEALGIELDDDELTEQQTLNGLVAFLEQRVGVAVN
jgi:acyl carrier protein